MVLEVNNTLNQCSHLRELEILSSSNPWSFASLFNERPVITTLLQTDGQADYFIQTNIAHAALLVSSSQTLQFVSCRHYLRASPQVGLGKVLFSSKHRRDNFDQRKLLWNFKCRLFTLPCCCGSHRLRGLCILGHAAPLTFPKNFRQS